MGSQSAQTPMSFLRTESAAHHDADSAVLHVIINLSLIVSVPFFKLKFLSGEGYGKQYFIF